MVGLLVHHVFGLLPTSNEQNNKLIELTKTEGEVHHFGTVDWSEND